jgi:hypothetical protein
VKLSTGDWLRVALAPMYFLLGSGLLYRFVRDTRVITVALLGVAFVAFGVYRVFLVWRALKSHSRC